MTEGPQVGLVIRLAPIGERLDVVHVDSGLTLAGGRLERGVRLHH
jgi:hypothetical protein